MSFFSWAWDWVTTDAYWHGTGWQGSGSIPQQLVAHLGYSALPLLIAALIGVPAGVAIGHRGGKGAVVVINVANACALSEMWFGHSDVSQDLVVVNVSEGIGTGIHANGRLLRGQVDAAGEFGHVQLDPKGPPCGCGSQGCWETLASNRAGLRYYNELSKSPAPSFENVVQLAEAEDKTALLAITKMSNALGRGMHMIVSALAPSEIVVVGEVTRLWDFVLPLIDAQLRRFPLISIPKLRVTDEPEKARLRSAVALVMNGKSP